MSSIVTCFLVARSWDYLTSNYRNISELTGLERMWKEVGLLPQSRAWLKGEADSSETSVHIYRITRRQIPEVCFLYFHDDENLKSHFVSLSLLSSSKRLYIIVHASNMGITP
jgi:hypothetical protein